ncbi:hypothetical protein EGW08_019447, partial [Elysia chlorotica]
MYTALSRQVKRMHRRMSIALLVFTITVIIVFNESARPIWIRSITDSVSGLMDPTQLYKRTDIDINANDVLVAVNIPRAGMLHLTDHIVRHAILIITYSITTIITIIIIIIIIII